MTPMSLGPLLLQVRLGLRRFGWINSSACALFLAGAMAWWLGIGYLRNDAEAPIRALQQAQQTLRDAENDAAGLTRSLPQERLTAFYHLLGEKRYAEQQVRTLFALAEKIGLTLKQAEYKSAHDKNSRSASYQMILPVKGEYPAIREFCEATLLAIPFASLDEISFKRDNIGSNTLEAKLHFTLYLSTPDTPLKYASVSGERQ